MNVNIPTLLRDGASFSAANPDRTERLKVLVFLAAVALGGCALFGFALGAFVGWDVACLDALKLMGIIAFAFALCFPTLYVFATLGGGQVGVAQITALGLTVTAMIGCLLAALAPIMWLFAVSTESLVFIVCFALALTAIALFFAHRPITGALGRGIIGSSSGYTAWLVVFTVVALQTVTLVRPMLDYRNAPRTPDGKCFFVRHFMEMLANPTVNPPKPPETAAQEVERLYQEYSKTTNQGILDTLMKKHPNANRTGCAVMYAAQRAADANERERLLKLAIEKYGDCRYGDGVQVAAQARWYLANLYDTSGKSEEARRLYNELKTNYPDAVNHKGRKFSEFLPK